MGAYIRPKGRCKLWLQTLFGNGAKAPASTNNEGVKDNPFFIGRGLNILNSRRLHFVEDQVIPIRRELPYLMTDIKKCNQLRPVN